MMHSKICPCPNCRGPAGTVMLAFVAVVAVATVAVSVWVWLAVVAGVVAVAAIGLAWAARKYGSRVAVAAWNGVLVPKAPLPAVEAGRAPLAIEAPQAAARLLSPADCDRAAVVQPHERHPVERATRDL
jgi:hypothetical protein